MHHKTDERINFDQKRMFSLVNICGGDQRFRNRCVAEGIVTENRTLGHRSITPETLRKGLSAGLLNRCVLEQIGLKFYNDSNYFFESCGQQHDELAAYFLSPDVFNGWLPGASPDKKLTGLTSHSIIDNYQLPNMYARFSQWLPFVGTADMFFEDALFLLKCLVEFSTHQLMGAPEKLRICTHNKLLKSACEKIDELKSHASQRQWIELLIIRGQLTRKQIPGKTTCWDKDNPDLEAAKQKARLHSSTISDFEEARALASRQQNDRLVAKVSEVLHHETMALARILAKRGTRQDLRMSVEVQKRIPAILAQYDQTDLFKTPKAVLAAKFHLVTAIALGKDKQWGDALAQLNQCKLRLDESAVTNSRLEHSATLLSWKFRSESKKKDSRFKPVTTKSDALERARNYFLSESPTKSDCFVEIPAVLSSIDSQS